MRPGARRVVAVAGVALALLATGSALWAQATITGRVTAQATNEPLGDAHVLVIGANAVTLTAQDGRYTLRHVKAGDVEVQVLRVGYGSAKKRVSVVAGATATLDFQLGQAVVQLQEIVTTATGQQRRVELGNAISTFGDVGKRVEQGAVNSFADILVAKAPGVIVLPGVMTGGAPTVRIRGLSSISLTNAPIYVVDGIRYESGTVNANGGQASYSLLNNLSPDEIEDIEIVKGPSAATLYGTNASNGVVVITTKKGRAGRTQWSFFGETGLVQDRNPYQAMYANWGHSPTDPTKKIRCKLATMGPTTCISDSLTSYNLLKDSERTFIHDGNRQLLGAQVSGGNEALRFFVSAEGDREIAPIRMPDFEIQRFESQQIGVRGEWLRPEAQDRLNFRANLNAALSPKLDVSVNTGFGTSYNRVPPSGSAFEALIYVGMMNYGFKGPGLDKVTTSANGAPLNDYLQYAPGDVMQRYRPVVVQRTTGSINANWRPLSWLQNDATIGVDLANRDRSDLCRLGECAPVGTDRNGRVADNKMNNRSFSAKVMSTAAWDARSWLNLKTTVGADYVNQEFDSTSSGGRGLPPGAQNVANAATPDGVGAAWPTAAKTLGLYIQEQASFRDRLFLTGALRSDQNSAFGTKFGNVLYPKASLSWIVSDESFFPNWSFVNQFRLRTSFGASGVQPGRTDGLITYTAGSQNLANRGTTTGVDVPALAANQTGNPELKPETSREYEVGFETQLLRNRVSLDYTYFDKRTKDALIRVDKAPSSAAADLSPLVNIGSTRDWGHEVVLTTQLVDTRRFGWDMTINGSHVSNEVLDLGIDPVSGEPRVLNPGSSRRNVAGYPINSRWYRPYSYRDANGDGLLQPSEVIVDTAFKYYGYSFPRDNVGITSGFDFFSRALRINVFFDHRGGFLLHDGGNNFQCNAAPFACRETQDPTAPLELQARNVAKSYGTTIDNTSYKTEVGYLSSGAFWKFREVSAAYVLPNVVLNQLRAQSGSSLVLAMRNIATWSEYTGVDPEEHDNPNDAQSNFQSVPPRTYLTVRLNLKY